MAAPSATAGGSGEGLAVDVEKQLQRALGDCVLDSSWLCSVIGALVAIPVGIRRKSLQPLVFFGSTGAMADIILGISTCERERAELLKHAKDKQAAAKPPEGEPQALPQSNEKSDLQ